MKKIYCFFVLVCLCCPGMRMALSQEMGVFTDERDGRQYRTVHIGEQTWMAENLAYLPVVDPVRSGVFDEECYWVYGYFGDKPAEAKQGLNYGIYGVHYNWQAAMHSCPDGWHLPVEDEWRELEQALGMAPEELGSRNWRQSGSVGKKLKKNTGWYENSGTDLSGFGALPGGCMGYNGFESMGFGAYFWTGTATSTENAGRRTLLFDDNGVERTEDRKYFGCSVRCVKDR